MLLAELIFRALLETHECEINFAFMKKIINYKMLCTALVKNLEAELHIYTNKLQNCNNSMKIPVYFQMQHFGSKYLRFV